MNCLIYRYLNDCAATRLLLSAGLARRKLGVPTAVLRQRVGNPRLLLAATVAGRRQPATAVLCASRAGAQRVSRAGHGADSGRGLVVATPWVKAGSSSKHEYKEAVVWQRRQHRAPRAGHLRP